MFAGLALLLAGGLYYFFGVHSPKRDNRLAVEEIERWEVRAAKVRTCLLGTTPASPNAAEAMAIRDLSNNPPEFKKCTAPIGELSRGNAPDTGLPEVESEWRSINSAASGVANAFSHLFDPGSAVHERAIVALGEALDLLDVRHRDLRNAAQMPPPSFGEGPALAKAELIPFGTKKRAKLSAWLRPSAGGMIVLVEGAGGPMQQVVLVPGEPPRRVPFQGDVRPSITDPTWAVQAGDGELIYGKLAADGSIEAQIGTSIGDKKAVPHILFTLGNAFDGAIAYLPDAARAPPQVALARMVAPAAEPSKLTGALLPGTPTDVDDYAFALDPPARGLLVWSTKGALRGILVRVDPPIPAAATAGGPAPTAAGKPVELGSGHTGLSCLTATHGWVASGDQFVAFDEASATPHVLPGHELIGCDATSVLLRNAGHRYSVCGAACRVVELAAGGDAVPGLAGGAAIAVASRQHVIAVWLEKGPPRYFALPSSIKPKLVHATAKLIDVIGETEEGLAIARIKL